ncbi:MAG: branched-chain amino acid ABC transporter permease [Methanoregulaceae archaeon]|nr:branched-chain amino acid ABC transporter permease [Methanoregulaceae archaeon]
MNTWSMRGLAIAALAVAVIIPFLPFATAYLLTLLILMFIFIIYASAWNFLAISGQGSLGHAAFFGIGGYASSLFATRFAISPFITLFLGAGCTALVGLLIGLTCVRLKEWFLAMVTFGFAIIIQTIIVSQQLAPLTGGWDGFAVPRLLSGIAANNLTAEYFVILVLLILTILALQGILQSRIGLALAAIRENELEARASGVDPVAFKLFAFTVSAFIAGLAGALEIHQFGYITPEIFGVELSFWPIIYSITGGLGTLAGPVIGTVAVTILWDGLNVAGLTYERFVVIGLLLILVIIFLPKGLISLPEKIRKRIGDR